MSILFNRSEDIKVGYFGNFEFVDSQIAHREISGNKPILFNAKPTKHNKTTAEKELYAFSELFILDFLFILLEIFMSV